MSLTDKAMIEAARRAFEDEGRIEFDDEPQVSRADDNPSEGAYVQCWVWVNDGDAR